MVSLHCVPAICPLQAVPKFRDLALAVKGHFVHDVRMDKDRGEPLPETPAPQTVRIEVSARTMVALVCVLAGVWVLIRLLPVVLVLIVALFIVGSMGPAVSALEARRVRRGLGIAIVFTAFFAVVVGLAALTIPVLVDQARYLWQQEPLLRAHLAERLADSAVTSPLADWLRNVHYAQLARDAAEKALGYSARILGILAYGLSAIFLALYMMIDRDRLRGALFALVPRSHHIRLSRVMMNLQTIVGGYIRGQVLTSALMAAFTIIVLTALRVPGALALGVLAGVGDVLPYIGIFFTVGPAVLVALSRGPSTAFVVLVLMLAYAEFENRILIPRVYGRALRLPSSVVFFSLLAGGVLMGITGALLALPVAAAVRMLIEELRVHLPGEGQPIHIERDERGEVEYERRVEGMPAVDAAAIAVEMTHERRREEAGAEDAAVPGLPPGDTVLPEASAPAEPGLAESVPDENRSR